MSSRADFLPLLARRLLEANCGSLRVVLQFIVQYVILLPGQSEACHDGRAGSTGDILTVCGVLGMALQSIAVYIGHPQAHWNAVHPRLRNCVDAKQRENTAQLFPGPKRNRRPAELTLRWIGLLE